MNDNKPVSVECRAISVRSDLPELWVTTAHLPGELTGGVSGFLANSLQTNRDTIVDLELIRIGFDVTIKHNIALKNYDVKKLISMDDERFSQFAIDLILFGRDMKRKIRSLDRNMYQESQFYAASEMNEYLKLSSVYRIEQLKTYFQLSSIYLSSIDYLNKNKSVYELRRKLFEYQVPYSHSPELGQITLQQLLNNGIRSACLFPLGAGVWSGTNNLISGHLGLGFQTVLTGGGMTICAISSLWITDKIMKGIRNLRDVDFRKDTSARSDDDANANALTESQENEITPSASDRDGATPSPESQEAKKHAKRKSK
ncbi:hypothetical protein VT84_37145 [Gemmata sp. SH-PL17]|uniref:hypothetical protein n=1 Tax=Gemmata sp. SH-PL17 TaxID=1630693 RepID=UPI00078D031A|nr:hypothetical protein [Gemmata sp. SH-PL17]AMV30080.1 hypothetical protein VT84_37145 [Gemmata sp. SH-PL17]